VTLALYIGRRFLAAFGAVLAIIMGLILLFDMIELLRRSASEGEMSFMFLLGMSFLKLPQGMNAVLPFAVMIGGIVAFWWLSRSHELVVMRAAGISAWQFLLPLLGIVLGIGVGNVAVINPLGAALYARYEHLEETILRRSNPLSLSENGLWLRETMGQYLSVVHAKRVRQEGIVLFLSDVSIFLFKEPSGFQERIEAESGILRNDGHYELYQALVMQTEKASVRHPVLRLPTTLTVGRIQENFASPETMSVWALPEFIRFFENSGFSARAHRLHLQTVMASPFLLCAMVLVAAVFVMPQNQRKGSMPWRIAGAIVTGSLVYFFSKVTHALGQSATLPVMLAAWSPTLIMSLLGLAAVFYFEDG